MNSVELEDQGASRERDRIILAINQLIASYAPITALPNHERNTAAKYIIPELEKLRESLEKT